MKKILLIILIITHTNAGLFGDTEEEKKNAKERLNLAMSLNQNPLIEKIRKENTYYKKILKKHHINYKSVIDQKKRAKQINNITNFFLVSEKKEIETLEQINKELIRLLEVNYIKYKKQNRNYKTEMELYKEKYRNKFKRKKIITQTIQKTENTTNTNKEREEAKEALKQAMKDVN